MCVGTKRKSHLAGFAQEVHRVLRFKEGRQSETVVECQIAICVSLRLEQKKARWSVMDRLVCFNWPKYQMWAGCHTDQNRGKSQSQEKGFPQAWQAVEPKHHGKINFKHGRLGLLQVLGASVYFPNNTVQRSLNETHPEQNVKKLFLLFVSQQQRVLDRT